MSKKPKQVYLVENRGNSDGQIIAVFDNEDDAYDFANMLPDDDMPKVTPRTLFYGQPSYRGYNQ